VIRKLYNLFDTLVGSSEPPPKKAENEDSKEKFETPEMDEFLREEHMSEDVSSVLQLDGTPAIVHSSDIHGYIEEFRSALMAVGETAEYDPIVTIDKKGRIHWADNDYVLVINGDLIDRGPANEACVEMAWRLLDEAPEGRIQYHIGNHELPILMPRLLGWPDTYSTERTDSQRHAFVERIIAGDISAAFEGYNYVYSHAGSNEPISPIELNKTLREAATTLADYIGQQNELSKHKHLTNKYNRLFGTGENGGRGPSAGLCWLDFEHLKETAPPQIVGHSMRRRPIRKGNVVCANVIRMNQGSDGGEGVLIETPDELTFVRRGRDGSVRTNLV